jgi:hypothetical protein
MVVAGAEAGEEEDVVLACVAAHGTQARKEACDDVWVA